MGFVTARELATSLKDTREKLSRDGDLTVTLNGKPIAIMIEVQEDDYEDTLKAIRQNRAMRLLTRMRKQAESVGFMSDDEIEAVIQESRREARTSA